MSVWIAVFPLHPDSPTLHSQVGPTYLMGLARWSKPDRFRAFIVIWYFIQSLAQLLLAFVWIPLVNDAMTASDSSLRKALITAVAMWIVELVLAPIIFVRLSVILWAEKIVRLFRRFSRQ